MRSSRRTRLAAPIVVTVAALAGCAPELVANPPPPPPNPPGPTPTSAPGRAGGDPSPSSSLPLPSDPSHVQKQADGSCIEYSVDHCGPAEHCNPPPPRRVQCPPGK